MIVSQLPALGIFAGRLAELPPELGLELHFETGNDYFWRHYVPMLMKDRTGPLSVHGPFSGINLADPDSDWPGALEEYKQCFAFCAKYGAVHCVCHPDAPLRKRPPERAAGDLSLAVERLMELQSEAQRFGVCMLVENLPSANSLFGWDVFLSELYGHEELSFLLDAGHAILSGWDMPDYMRRMGGRLKAIHIHEPFNGLDAHLPVGSGHVDWTDFFAAYKQYTPNAKLILEYEKADNRQILDSVEYIRAFF